MARDHRDPQRGAPGKLIAVARRWAELRQGGRDELDDDLRVFDLADQIDAKNFCPGTGATKHQPVGIWPENALTVRVFFDQEYQWLEKTTADGPVSQGLDHGQIKNTLELLCVKRRQWPEVFNGLKVMEAEAIRVMRNE